MKAAVEIVRKYYKYKNWEQPILSSNGVMGGTDFACNQSNSYNSTTVAWRAFNGDNSTEDEANRWQINNVNTSSWYWLSWYSPTPLIIKGLTIYNSQTNYVVKAYKIQGSDDNLNWVDITTGTNTNTAQLASWQINMSNNSALYQYFRIYCQPNSSTSLMIAEIEINAEEIDESTEQDYDFYKDISIYKIVKQNDTYKAPRSWEKGQYYGN